MRLLGEVVRRPDVVFIQASRLTSVDLRQSPLGVAPDLVIEIVSANDRADDLMLKVKQYLNAGARAVWLIYPDFGQAYRYVAGKLQPEVRTADDGGAFEEPELLTGFVLPLADVVP